MTEPVNLFIETHTDCNAAGSATWDNFDHHVTFSIYGPDEAKPNEELTHRAYVDVIVSPQTGQRTPKEMELEIFLSEFLERLIDVKVFPRSRFIGRLFIVTGVTNDPYTVASAINAASLALLLSALPLRATVAAVCATINNTVLTIAVDVTHPQLAGKKYSSIKSSIFAIYSGQSKSLLKNPNKVTDITSITTTTTTTISNNNDNKQLSSCQIPIEDFLNTIQIPTTEQTNSIYKQALEIVDVMVSQIASCTHIK